MPHWMGSWSGSWRMAPHLGQNGVPAGEQLTAATSAIVGVPFDGKGSASLGYSRAL